VAIKYDPIRNRWIVSYSKRHPLTRVPLSRRRVVDSKAEAKRVEKELVVQVDRLLHAEVVPNWEVVVQDFLQSRLTQSLWTLKTHKSYQDCLMAHTVERWGGRSIDSIKTEEIRELVLGSDHLKSDGNREYVLKSIRGVFSFAVDRGLIVRNPCPQHQFRKKLKLDTVFNKAQASTLLSKAKESDWDWYPHVFVALYSGMRNGELYALRWSNVDFVKGVIRVCESWNSRDGFKETKSGDDRFVPIAPELRCFLDELKSISPNSEFVLPRMARWDNGEQARELKLFLKAIGLPPIRFHDLRATWATLLLSTGVSALKVMKIGGWKNYETMDRYLVT